MKLKILAVLMLAMFAIGCNKSKGAVGDDCSADSDCESGICLDVSTVDDDCSGMVCTVTCEDNDECSAIAEDGDCEGVAGRRVCLWEPWEERFCGD